MNFQNINKLQKNDKVALVSPSSTVASVFTPLFDLGVQRLMEVFALTPVIFPHCQNTHASYQDKAEDLHRLLVILRSKRLWRVWVGMIKSSSYAI